MTLFWFWIVVLAIVLSALGYAFVGWVKTKRSENPNWPLPRK